jgi:predicted dehydrogenase
VDHGIHLVDIFGWMMSSPVEAVYGVGQISGESPVPEYAVLEYRNGAIGHLIYHSGTYGAELPSEGIFSEAPDWADLVASEPGRAEGGRWQEQPGSIRVYGTHGSLRIYHYANRLFLRNAAGLREIALPNRLLPAQFGAELASLAGSIVRGEEPAVTGQVGREALRAVLGIYRSMALRQRIVLA